MLSTQFKHPSQSFAIPSRHSISLTTLGKKKKERLRKASTSRCGSLNFHGSNLRFILAWSAQKTRGRSAPTKHPFLFRSSRAIASFPSPLPKFRYNRGLRNQRDEDEPSRDTNDRQTDTLVSERPRARGVEGKSLQRAQSLL